MDRKQIRRQRRIYIAAAMVFIAFLVCSFAFMEYASRENKQETRDYIQEIAQRSKLTIDKQIQGDFQTLTGIAEMIGGMENPDFEALLPTLETINLNNKFIRMGFTDKNGMTMGVDLDGTYYYDVDLSQKGFAQRAFQGENVLTKTQKAEIGDFWVNFYAVPIWQDGEVIKVLCAVNPATEFSEVVDASIFGGKGFTSIIDKEGNFVIRSNHPSVDKNLFNIFDYYRISEEDMAFLKENLRQGNNGFVKYYYGGENRWVAYAPLEFNDWFVFSVVPEGQVNQNFSMMLWAMTAIVAVAAAIFLFLILLIRRVNNQGIGALKKIAYSDSLTGYRNYAKFLMDAQEMLKHRGDKVYSFWYCDLKGFKYINDLFSYDVGDRVLKYWADMVERHMREGEAFGRVSGDNFVGLCVYESREETQERFDLMAEALASYPETAERGYKIEICAGIYVLDENDGEISVNDMLDRANVAQKSVKNMNGSRCGFYSSEMRDRIISEAELETKMEAALHNGEFRLYLQAKIDIQHDDMLEGAEALVRWIDPERGMISPAEFIPLFERDGFIIRLDRYMFETVCKEFRKHLDEGTPAILISVNVSRLCMMQPDFVDTYVEIKNRYGVPDNCIELEFTESIAFYNHDMFRDVVSKFQQNGFLCSLDDFGAGHSSLNILKNLPVDVLKLDMLFFREDEGEKRGRELIRGIVNMAKALHMKTVAEGVESMEQVEFLREIGCDVVQGYVYARPMPVCEFDKFANAYIEDHPIGDRR